MRRPGLRARVMVIFAVGALFLSVAMALLSYELTRSSLLNERERTATRTTYFDATVIQPGLSADRPDISGLLQALNTGSTRRPVLRYRDRWYSRDADTGVTRAIPASLRQLVEAGQPGAQIVSTEDGPALVLGIPLPSSQFYEVHSLRELDDTLRLLGLILGLVAAGTALGGAGLAWYATRRVLRPLASVTAAAHGIAAGDLSARLDPAAEPELRPLTSSFNDMVDQLSKRMERDRRFAADVSHELRSPLQTLAAAAAVLTSRRVQLDERSAVAAGLVADEVARFQHLVTDLLELARADQKPDVSDVDMGELARRVCRSRGVPPQLVDCDDEVVWEVDRRRVEQVLANLIDNAKRHGGGPVAVRIHRDNHRRVIEVDDDGPGVVPEDRTVIFEPFVRGRGARARGDGDGDGTGLGLALVHQHVLMHGGRIVVDDRPGGGARFRIELPEDSNP